MQGAADGIGDIATGTLIAREVERAHAGAPALGHDVHEACANCGTMRCGPYCHACGQAGHVHRSLGALVHDIAHGVFHFEGKLWNTLPLLGWRPGELTRRYVHGERARFVSPMALFLFSVFLMFAVVSHLAGHGGGAPPAAHDKAYYAGRIAEAQGKLARSEAELAATTDAEDRRDLAGTIADRKGQLAALQARLKTAPARTLSGADAQKEALDQVRAQSGWHWLDEAINHAAANPQLLLYKMKSNGYKYSWALIPISLPFIWLLFAFRRDTGGYDHAIFAIYSLSFMSLAVVALTVLSRIGVPTGIIAPAAMIIPPVHMYRQLKGAYRLGRFGALWRTAALLAITLLSSILFLAFLFYMGSE